MITTAVMTKRKRSVHYVNNKEFLSAMVDYRVLAQKAKDAGEPKPRIPNYLGECFLKIATHLSFKPNFVNYCVDADTEALTQRGWLKYNEITLDDKILSYDKKSRNLVWSSITDIFINENYDDTMHHLTNKGLDMFVTPGHKVMTDERGLVEVERLRALDHITLMGFPLDSNDEIWDDYLVKDVTLTNELILSLSQRQRLLIINRLIDGGFNHRDKQQVDQIIFLCTISGLTTITTLEDGYYNVEIIKTSISSCEVDSSNKPTVKYKGTIWCPSTEYGCFMCRRNGRVFITGNSYKDDMISDAVENCLQYCLNFDPEKSSNPFAYFTQVTHYAFLRRIQREKRQLEIKNKILERTGFDEVFTDDNNIDGSNYSDYNSIKENIQTKLRN